MEHPPIRISPLLHLADIAKSISIVKHDHSYITTERSYYAEKIFGKIAMNVGSICCLLPQNRKVVVETVDVSSIASLARNLVEAYKVLHYICVERISEEELEFRVNLMDLHHSIELQKVLSSFGFGEDNTIRIMHTMSNAMSKSALEKNSRFQALEESEKKNLLKGRQAYFRKSRDIQRSPIDSQLEDGIYKFLSNSVHSAPMSLQNYYDWKNTTPLDSPGVLFLAIETAILYVAASINAYIRIRWNIAKLVSDENKAFMRSLINDAYIMEWIEYWKWYDDKKSFGKLISKP